ncbi:MAG: 3-phosphoglycerate dehydrogenase [Betaproteobacteria bacterium SG8_39]|nr:MAG: 3-phosphoglycerate dehydrogenase [Betaproteobacteria bacterium SG8_39]
MAEAAARKTEVLVLDPVSPVGLKGLPGERYAVVSESAGPDVILLRSRDLHAYAFGAELKAIGRAGAGVNNIPVPKLSVRGIPVFNAPGANANAVKELVLAGMLMAARNIGGALEFVRALDPMAPDLGKRVESGKKAFAGVELPGQTLGVIGLGKIGSLVADVAIRLGMRVLGFDPEITVDAAWGLPSQVRRARSIDEVLKGSDFVTVHVPLLEQTRHLIGAKNLAQLRPGAVLLNFSREEIVEDAAVVQALQARRLGAYVTDFPSSATLGQAGVIALPHLGASTREAEENCAVMVVEQLRAYLEHGDVTNAVNFPDACMPRESPYRLAIANANVPDMLAGISHTLGARGINIHNMLNKSRGEMAYTLVDVDTPVGEAVLGDLRAIGGVLGVRYLPDLRPDVHWPAVAAADTSR